MGGIATGIRKDESQFCLKVDEGENDDEYLITRHSQFKKPVNVINVQGEQEGRSKNHEVEERWSKICQNLKVIEDRNEEVILIGDMNKLIVQGNNSKVSFGVKLIHNLLSTEKYYLLNNSSKCAGGPFTREDPSDPNIKSCLSLVIISSGLEEYVEELVVDNERRFTPHRPTRNRLIFTDHYSLIFKLKGIPLKTKSFKCEISPVIWNTNKEGGCEKYRKLTTKSKLLEEIAENAKWLSTDEMMTQIFRWVEKFKF